MATATTKPITPPVARPSQAPASKAPATDPAAKGNAKATPGTTTHVIHDPGMVLHGAKITVDNNANANKPVLDGPAVADANAAPQSDTSAPTTFDLAEGTVQAIRKGGVRVRPLSKQEVDDFEMYEAAVDEGLPKFLAVGEALYLIQQRKLYRMQYKTFAEYCEKRFGLSRQNAYLQIAAAEVTENLSSNGL